MSNKIWPILLLVLLNVSFVWYVERSKNRTINDYEAQSKAQEKLHQKELEALSKARKTEKDQLEANIVKLQNDLADNQKVYEKKLNDLIAKKGRDANNLSKKSPVDLAVDVSSVTGFKIYHGQLK